MSNLTPGIIDNELVTLIYLVFNTESGDPSRVFRSMAMLIEAICEIEKDLASTISTQICPVQVLQEVETGSVKAWIRTIINQVDDDALKNLDWKPLIGQFLVKAKKTILKWLSEHDRVEDSKALIPLEAELQRLAENTDVLRLPAYASIPRRRLLADFKTISECTSILIENDNFVVMNDSESIPINKGFQISSEKIEELLTDRIERDTTTLTLLVKKPDYLGMSMWILIYEDHSIEAKILDEDWLGRFHSRQVDIRPGDSIRADVEMTIRKAKDGSIISVRVFVNHVIEVIRPNTAEQLKLTDSNT